MQFILLLFFYCLIHLAEAEHCARFAERSDGDISYDPDEEIGLQLGSIATLQCHNGNIRRSRCTANGWKPPVFNRCQQVMRDESNSLGAFGDQFSSQECPPITNVSNGFVAYGPLGLPPYRPGSTASLICNLGFLPSGSTSARCEQSGTWSELGTCESSTIQKCVAIGDIANGRVSYKNGSNGALGLNSVAELTCKLGFSAVGNTRVTCSQNGWEPHPGLGNCIEGISGSGQCPTPSVLNGNIAYLQATLESCCASGSTALLTCNPGFSPIGATSSYCAGTTWSPPLGTCQQGGSAFGLGGVPTLNGNGLGGTATCPALPAPLNGQISYSMGGSLGPFATGTTATIQCNPGFSVNTGLATASCQNGVWNPTTLGQCVSNPNGIGGIGGAGMPGSCPAAPMVANGQLQYSTGTGLASYPELATVTLICNAFYQINGPATSTCRSGQWYPPLGICTNQGGQNPNNGIGGIGGIGGPFSSACSIGMAPPIGGGTVQYSTGNGIGPWPQGTTATLVCPANTISSASVSTCQSGGQWNPPMFQPCSGNGNGLGGIGGLNAGSQCLAPLAVIGGIINYSNGQALPPFPSNTVATLRCNNGLPSGPSSSSCLNGMWNPPNLGPCSGNGLPSFIGSTVDQCTFGILNPANGRVTYSQNGLGPFPGGTSATLTCNPNFVLSGNSTSYCQGGAWSPPTLGQCLPSNGVGGTNSPTLGASNCFPLNVVNGQVSYNSFPSLTGTYPISTSASIVCNLGLSPVGGPTSTTCLSNGWSTQQLATCSGATGR